MTQDTRDNVAEAFFHGLRASALFHKTDTRAEVIPYVQTCLGSKMLSTVRTYFKLMVTEEAAKKTLEVDADNAKKGLTWVLDQLIASFNTGRRHITGVVEQRVENIDGFLVSADFYHFNIDAVDLVVAVDFIPGIKCPVPGYADLPDAVRFFYLAPCYHINLVGLPDEVQRMSELIKEANIGYLK